MNPSSGYIDVHSHILPRVDDGSGSMEETILMLTAAAKQKINTIIATPHYIAGGTNMPVDELKCIRDQVQEQAYKINPDMKIYLGHELYYSESILSALESKEALTLADSRYILVEFSVNEEYETMFRALGEFVRAGYLPILAHVERYRCLYRGEYLVEDIIELGCYIQMNSHSLIGNIFNSEAVLHRKMVNRGLVHLLGSDCHDSKYRVPCMDSAVRTLLKKCDEKLVNRLVYENSFKILENTYI